MTTTSPWSPTTPPTTPVAPDGDNDGWPDSSDCAPADPLVFPGSPDVCGDDLVTSCADTLVDLRSSDDGLVTVAGGFTTESLATALGMAVAGDDILVCPGTYVGPFTAAVPVHLRSHAGADVTTLSGAGAGTTVSLVGGSLEGFTVTDGDQLSYFYPFIPTAGGGVQLVGSGSLTITDSVITGNAADAGAGIFVGPDADLVLVRTFVSANDGTQGAGGGLWMEDGSSATLELSEITDNHTSYDGGGVYMSPGSTLSGGVVARNSSGDVYGCGDGGGIHAWGQVTISDVSITGNEASCDAYPGGWYNLEPVKGGGVYIYGSATLSRVVVSDNIAGEGGGIYLVDGPLTVTDFTITGNSGWRSGGGGIDVQADGPVLVELVNGEISSNDAPSGGGIRTDGADLTLRDVQLNLNTASDGAGVLVRSGEVVLSSCDVWGNVATDDGGGVFVDLGGALTSDHTDWRLAPDSNSPSDVDFGGVAYLGLGLDVSFTCVPGNVCE